MRGFVLIWLLISENLRPNESVRWICHEQSYMLHILFCAFSLYWLYFQDCTRRTLVLEFCSVCSLPMTRVTSWRGLWPSESPISVIYNRHLAEAQPNCVLPDQLSVLSWMGLHLTSVISLNSPFPHQQRKGLLHQLPWCSAQTVRPLSSSKKFTKTSVMETDTA